jgi:hypothetical protein
MTTSTVTSLNSLFNSIFEDAIFVARETNLMAGLVTQYTGGGMADRKLGIYPTLSAQQVAEGTDYANATEWTKTSQMSITPANYMVQVVLTDQRIATDPDDARRDAAREMGAAVGTKIDTDLTALMADFSTDLGATGSSLTVQRCANAMAKLRTNKAPNPINFVLHPYGWLDIWTELGQPASNKAFLGDVASAAMRDFYVGDWMGAAWFTDANIALDSTPDAFSGAFHREAIALDTRRAPTLEVERDASKLGWELNMSVWYGTGERRDSFGIQLTHDATAPS